MELYDLGADPGERNDLSTQYSDLADSMRRFAKSWLAGCGQDVPEPPATRLEDMDEQVLENLRSLGYLD